MDMNRYVGHHSQVFGVEEHRLVGGKGDGMRLFEIRNGKGLMMTVSADRCADISRLSFDGENMGYFAPVGYVGPAFYDDVEDGFHKSFTAGFLTTCGLTSVGVPVEENGRKFPLHGTIGNCPAESIYAITTDKAIEINAVMIQGQLFTEKLVMNRKISCSLEDNSFTISDTVRNIGDQETPLMILYHFNMGYPLLSEQTELFIPADEVMPRNAHSAQDLDTWNKVIPPQEHFEEQCYYHQFSGKEGRAEIYNPAIGKGVRFTFDRKELDYFTQWKMMGVRDYVMGLEPGNCLPDGRLAMREKNDLKILKPGEEKTFCVKVEFFRR